MVSDLDPAKFPLTCHFISLSSVNLFSTHILMTVKFRKLLCPL